MNIRRNKNGKWNMSGMRWFCRVLSSVIVRDFPFGKWSSDRCIMDKWDHFVFDNEYDARVWALRLEE